MRWRGIALLFILVLALVPGSALAQDGNGAAESFVLSVNNDTHIQAGQTVDTLVVISEDAVIDGTVTGALVVIDGGATVRGTIDGDVTVFSGTITMEDGAVATRDVLLINSDINQTAEATVAGKIQHESYTFYRWQLTMLSVLFWIGGTIVLLLAGLLFAAIAGRQLTGSATLITEQPGKTALAGLFIGIVVPIAAVIALFTLIGIPLGIAILLFALPAIAFAGYLVAGTKIGALLLGVRKGERQPVEHPYLAIVIGLMILQIVSWIPGIGFLLVSIASLMGVGAVALYAYRAWRGTGTPEAPTMSTTPQPAPAA